MTGEVNCWKRRRNSASRAAARTQGQHIADEVHQARIEVGPAELRLGHGLVDFLAVFIGNLIARRHDIGSVDGEAGSDLAQGAANLGARVVAAIAVVLADLDK